MVILRYDSDFKKRAIVILKSTVTKFILFIIKVIYFPFSLIIILIFRCLAKFIIIRFVRLYSYSMGDYTISSELYLCYKLDDAKKNNFDLIYYENSKICNLYWHNIVKQSTGIKISSIIGHQIVKICEYMKWYEHIYSGYKNFGRDTDSLLEKYPLQLKLNESEIHKGKKFLKNLGITEKDKYICINVRDQAYHNDTSDVYRDSDIDHFVLAAETLANMGYYMFRMGSKVHKKFNTNHPKIFDYATNGMRNEFLDIFLGSECYFCISTGTGWDSVPALYRRPLIFVNCSPVAYFPTYFKNCIFQSKNHYSILENRFLTLSEIISRKICYSLSIEEFNRNSITLLENTPEEILATCLEMVTMLTTNIKDPDEEQLQVHFWKNYDFDLISKTGLPLHGKLNARHSISFLKKYPHWLS